MTAERLRQAADRLRELVEDDALPKCAWALSDQWSDETVTAAHDDTIWIVGASPDGGGPLNREVAQFIATMNPVVALALANWLEKTASRAKGDDDRHWTRFNSDALAVAHAVLRVDG